jgi:formate-dependent phosphoribosylglycinamide formyltransferase (GAR transformylase)
MEYLKGKRLLLLGSNLWKDSLKQYAQANGVYTIFAGLYPGPLDEIANEYHRIDSTDPSVMIPFIKEHNIDGIFMGGSELIISKACDYINLLGYPCYCTKEQWDILQNKKLFKEVCRKYKVPTVPEYSINDGLLSNDFPVIVKPIDSCGSRGISICHDERQYLEAKQKALGASPSSSIIIEKYVDNGGLTLVVSYIAIDGNYYLDSIGDRYVLTGGLITAASFFPSTYLNNWLKTIDSRAKEMLKGLGIKNGVVSFQALPDGDSLYVYECCFRLTGGMTYKMTEAICGHSSFKMLLKHTLTGIMGDKDDISLIDASFKGQKGISLTIPLRTGTIGKIEGADDILSHKQVIDFTQYYKIGEAVSPQSVNTLDQLFARIMAVGESKEELLDTLYAIRQRLRIVDTEGNNMIIWETFDKLYSKHKS